MSCLYGVIDMNLDVAPVTMSAIAHIDKCVFRFSCNPLYLFKGFIKCMTIVRISVKCPASDNPASFGGGGHRNLATELVALVSFALADAFHLRGVNAANLVFVVPFLFMDPFADIQQFLQFGVRVGMFSFNNRCVHVYALKLEGFDSLELSALAASVSCEKLAGKWPVVFDGF